MNVENLGTTARTCQEAMAISQYWCRNEETAAPGQFVKGVKC